MERNEISSLLEQLYRHRESCEMIWLKTDEDDSPESELAREHLNGVEECVQIVRAWADDALSAQADCDTISGRPHDMPKSADCISRQAAIDAVKKNTFRLTFAEEQNCEGHVAWSANAVYSDVMEGALLELPSADAVQVVRKNEQKEANA